MPEDKPMISIFWFRRDLRLEDNTALDNALRGNIPVLPLFIFDRNVLDELPPDDARITFIYESLLKINVELQKFDSSLLCLFGDPVEIWEYLTGQYNIKSVYTNRDYEPYAIQRDKRIKTLLDGNNIEFRTYKDQVIFEGDEVLKGDGKPYTVYTPYKNRWLKLFLEQVIGYSPAPPPENYFKFKRRFLQLEETGFKKSKIRVKDYRLSCLDQYAEKRDFPSVDGTSLLSPHLRFGTVSIRKIISGLKPEDNVFLSELIWREFFMQILYHFPHVVNNNFRPKYNGIRWRNDDEEFEKWCRGITGYPIVDAGMRELNQTGYMHNRVRMITAGFLCKHLLSDWQRGEAYFAGRLLDYELSSNNGNWQWAAGTGCDAAPYFRIFNPNEQLKKFDKNLEYVRKWVPEYGTPSYPKPIVDHSFARERALASYQKSWNT